MWDKGREEDWLVAEPNDSVRVGGELLKKRRVLVIGGVGLAHQPLVAPDDVSVLGVEGGGLAAHEEPRVAEPLERVDFAAKCAGEVAAVPPEPVDALRRSAPPSVCTVGAAIGTRGTVAAKPLHDAPHVEWVAAGECVAFPRLNRFGANGAHLRIALRVHVKPLLLPKIPFFAVTTAH